MRSIQAYFPLTAAMLHPGVEQLTWSQLEQHQKPIVLANIDGFWDPLLALFGDMKGEGFIRHGLELHLEVVDRVSTRSFPPSPAPSCRATKRRKRRPRRRSRKFEQRLTFETPLAASDEAPHGEDGEVRVSEP